MKPVKVIIALLILLGGCAGLTYVFWLKPQMEFAAIATTFAAKKACSCLYVAELPFERCQNDFTDDVSMATFEATNNGVSVSVLGGRVSSHATYTPELGCRLLPPEAGHSSANS